MYSYRIFIFLLTLLLIGCTKDSDSGPIYLAANGITIICNDSGIVGDTFEVNGVTYTIVGNSYKIVLKGWLTTINFIDITGNSEFGLKPGFLIA